MTYAPRPPRALAAALVIYIVMGAFAALLPAQAMAQPQRVEAQGMATVLEGDTAAARAKALDQALRSAVEKQVGVMLTSETMVRNSTLVGDKILNRSQGYISSYEILRQGAEPGGMYSVTVAAMVEKGPLEADLDNLGLLQALKGKPKVAIFIQETIHGAAGTFARVSQAETRLVQTFMDKGFQVVDPSILRATASHQAAMQALAGNDKAAAALAKNLQAQVMILGKADASAGTAIRGTSMKTVVANLNARAVETDSARIIASGSASSTKAHVNPAAGGAKAISSASNKLAKQLMDQIASKWQQDVYGQSAALTLILTDIPSFLALEEIRAFLEYGVQGVKDVQQHSYASGTAELGLDYAGSSRDLALALAKKQFGAFRLNPVSVTPNALTVETVGK